MCATVEHHLAVHADDARGAIVAEHREHLSDPLARERRIAAAEEPRLDRLIAVDQEERPGIGVFEVRLHVGRAIGVQEDEARLAGDRIAEQRAQLAVGLEVDEPGRVDARVAVVRRDDDERVARLPIAGPAA